MSYPKPRYHGEINVSFRPADRAPELSTRGGAPS